MLSEAWYFPGSHKFWGFNKNLRTDVMNFIQHFHETCEVQFYRLTGDVADDLRPDPNSFIVSVIVRQPTLCAMMTAVYSGLSNNLSKN